MSNKVSYSIGTNPMDKNNYTLHLWRTYKSRRSLVATFSNHTMTEMFAKEFDFPLSDEVKRLLNTVQLTGQ